MRNSETQDRAPRFARHRPRVFEDHGGDLASHPGVRLDFSVSVNPLGTPPPVRAAILDAMATITQYPDPQCRALRRALAAHHGVDPAQIGCGNGASDIISRVLVARRPRRVLTVAPTFTEYERSARFIGAEVVHHRLRPPLFDVDDAILNTLTSDIDMVFLCQPNNPTGRLIPPDLLAAIGKTTASINAMLVLDECFLPFTDAASMIPTSPNHPATPAIPTIPSPPTTPTPATPPALPPHVVVIRAFTKTHGLAGLRLGYVVAGDPSLTSAITEQPPHWNVSSLAQRAGCVCADLPDWDDSTRVVVSTERRFLTDQFARLGIEVVDSHSNFLLFRARADLQTLLEDQGILIRSCSTFAGLDETYFRVGLHTHPDNVELVEAMEKALTAPTQPEETHG